MVKLNIEVSVMCITCIICCVICVMLVVWVLCITRNVSLLNYGFFSFRKSLKSICKPIKEFSRTKHLVHLYRYDFGRTGSHLCKGPCVWLKRSSSAVVFEVMAEVTRPSKATNDCAGQLLLESGSWDGSWRWWACCCCCCCCCCWWWWWW